MTSKEIWKKQIETIAYVKNYLIKCKKSKINTANSSFCYFAHWGYTPGAAKLKLKLEGTKYILSYLKVILFNILGVSTLSNYIAIKHDIKNKKFKNLIITNVSKKDFRKDGSCFDPCFQTNSRKVTNSLWFLNCIDNYIPKKFDKNIIISNHFEPFVKKNIMINFAILKKKKSSKLYLFKGDCDQERPNILNK